MYQSGHSLYTKKIPPFVQAGLVLGLMLIFNLFALIVAKINILSIKEGAPWLIFTSFMLFFALTNSVLSISSSSKNRYWLYSLLSYAGLGITGGLLAYFFSGLSMDEAGSYRWILIIFTFSYILFISIVRAMKKIVTIAQKQDSRLRGEEESS